MASSRLRGQILIMQVTRRGEFETVLTHHFAVACEPVFRAMTEPDHIRQWMKPERMTLTICEVDLRPGGGFRYGFEMAKGRKLEVRGLYHTVNAPAGYSYTESYDFSPLTIEVVTLLAESAGLTTFEQVLTYRSARERDEDFPGVEESSKAVYQILDQYLQGR